MPAKRVIILESSPQSLRAVMWADVPAGNQIAKYDPNATSQYPNITPAELQAIRDGLVVERAVSYSPPSGSVSIPTAQTVLSQWWSAFQAEVTAESQWTNFGAFCDSVGAWQTTTGVPMAKVSEAPNGLPSFLAITGVSAFAANKLHFVLHNGAVPATSAGLLVKVRLVLIQPVHVVVTGVNSGPWTLRRRSGVTTPPSGTGGVAVALMDSAQSLPATITAWNAPQFAPAGGTLATFNTFLPPADEQALSTLNQPGMAAVLAWAGQIVYRANDAGQTKPITLRAGECLEIVQDATAGTGNCRVLTVFTVG